MTDFYIFRMEPSIKKLRHDVFAVGIKTEGDDFKNMYSMPENVPVDAF